MDEIIISGREIIKADRITTINIIVIIITTILAIDQNTQVIPNTQIILGKLLE